jgi:chitosanase
MYKTLNEIINTSSTEMSDIIVSAKLDIKKKNTYKGILNIKNNSFENISNWNISFILSKDSSITNCKYFEISGDKLIPKNKKIKILKPNFNKSFRFEGNGDMPTQFIVNIEESTPIIPVYDIDHPSDIILKLVSIAENSSTEWQKQINYIENINDGRGYTISIVGFCTGTGDFIQVLKEIQKIDSNHPLVKFIPSVEKVDGTSSVKGLEGLPDTMKAIGINDAVFNQAMWLIIKKLYWGPALEYCERHNLTSNLSKYIAYDTILNFGIWNYNKKYNLDSIVNSDETTFLEKFLEFKQKTIEADKSLGDSKKNRVDMQKKLLSDKNFSLSLPMTVSCYGDTFTITN